MWGLLVPVVGLAVCVITHLLLARVPAMSRPRSAMTGVCLGLLVVLVVAVFLRLPLSELFEYAVAWSAAYTCLAYCYVIGFYNSGESARRIRLLIELQNAGQRGMTREEVLAAYDGRTIISLRLGRLLAGRQLIEREGRYVVGRREMLSVATLLGWWGRVTMTSPESRQA